MSIDNFLQAKGDFISATHTQKVALIEGFIFEAMVAQEGGTGSNRFTKADLDALGRMRDKYARLAGIEVGNLGTYVGEFRRGG